MRAKFPKICLKYGLTTQNVNSNIADNDLAIDALLQFALVYSITDNLDLVYSVIDNLAKSAAR